MQARSTNEEAIGRQVQSDDNLLQSSRAPIGVKRDAGPVAAGAQEAPVSPATSGESNGNDVVAEDDDNDSLFDGDDDAAATQLALPLCLPGSDMGTCPIAYLAGTSAAPAPGNTLGANTTQANQPAGAAPSQTGSSNGAPAAQPPATPSTSKKRGARKSAQRGQAKPPAPPPSDEDVKRAAQMESERRARLNKAVLGQTPELRARHAWMNASTVAPAPRGTGIVPASAPLAAPVAGSGPRPRPNLGSMHDRMATVAKRMYPMTGPAPLKKPYWCKTCWKGWVLDTFWYNPRQLEAHVKRKHREQLGTGVWRHEGM